MCIVKKLLSDLEKEHMYIIYCNVTLTITYNIPVQGFDYYPYKVFCIYMLFSKDCTLNIIKMEDSEGQCQTFLREQSLTLNLCFPDTHTFIQVLILY